MEEVGHIDMGLGLGLVTTGLALRASVMQVQQTTYLRYCVPQVRCLLYLHKPNSAYALPILVVLRTTSVKLLGGADALFVFWGDLRCSFLRTNGRTN